MKKMMNRITFENIEKKLDSLRSYLFFYGCLLFGVIGFIHSGFVLAITYHEVGLAMDSYPVQVLGYLFGAFGFWLGTIIFLLFLGFMFKAIKLNKRNFEE